MRPPRLLAAALIAAGVGTPVVVSAQLATAAGSSRNSCIEAIPDSALHRVPVYLTAGPVEPGSVVRLRLLPEGMALVTQAIAQAGRSLLGAAEGVLPPAEPSMTWRSLEADVRIVARRDGSVDARVVPPRFAEPAWANDAGARFVMRAIDTAWARGERLFFPDSLPIDSLAWLLRLQAGVVSEDGNVTMPTMEIGIPIFSVRVPTEQQVAVERVRPSYPSELHRAGFVAHVLMEFVVDTTGRVDRTTLHDVRPADPSTMNNKERAAYDAFLRSVRLALESGRFRPARIGGCAVRQLVRQPFEFTLSAPPPPGP